MSEKKCNNSETEVASEMQSFAFEREPWGMLKTYEKNFLKKFYWFSEGFYEKLWILGWWSQVISFLTFGL